MRFGSVCSGIEAASVAWQPLGWKAAWFSEIEPFPSAVLAHHYPEVPNLGDMKKLPVKILRGDAEAPDVFCGGTPCQAFSVAGLRKSLDDARGNLSLTFCEIADAIDHVRAARGKQPAIIFWENVPGVLSTQDNAFGCFLAGLAGEDEPLQPPGEKWANAGCVYGPTRAVAWRTLDAQYFGLAQRRRRVFVVASARQGFDPAAVLFEWNGLRRDTAPSREAGKAVAPTIRSGAPNSSASRGAWSGDSRDELIVPVAFGGNRTSGPIDVAPALNACGTASDRQDFETEAFITTTHTLRGEGFDASEDGTGRGTPLVPVAYTTKLHNTQSNQAGKFYEEYATSLDANSPPPAVFQPYTLAIRDRGDSHNLEYRQDGTANALLTPNGGRGGIGVGAIAFAQNQRDEVRTMDVAGALAAEPGAKQQTYIAFTAKDHGGDATEDLSPTLRAGGHAGSHANAGVMPAIAFHPTQDPISSVDVCHAIGANDNATAAVAMRESGQGYWMQDDIAGTIDANMGMSGHANRPAVIKQPAMQVRRLTPVECERLQGFPDGYTAIPWRNKPASDCPDGPRYKALGNSWAVPVVRWIGKRIQQRMNAKACLPEAA